MPLDPARRFDGAAGKYPECPIDLLDCRTSGPLADRSKMRLTWIGTAVALVAIAAASYGFYLYLRPAPLPSQLLYGNGHIEGTEVRTSAEVAGRVLESTLIEGTTVAKGDVLIRIDDTDLALERARRAADIAAIERERKQFEVNLATWRHHLRTAERDVARYRQLQERGTVPPQRGEQAEDSFRNASGRVAVLEAQLAEFDARLEAARKALELIEYQIGKTEITSPINGTVLVKVVEPGEFVQPGDIVAVLVDLSRIELKVFIPEKDIGKVKLGDAARVRVDAFPDRRFESSV
ncbi:MAG TPA: efflux RND transporter periplasmic adaptor subunit, partial [Sphingomonadaceae bacterium]|nr:efflux RND transporter periplasmic adaptor subunit [Sphingomonadaceae bacterium]